MNGASQFFKSLYRPERLNQSSNPHLLLDKEHTREPTCSAHVYGDCGGGMSKQTAADVPGVPVAIAGVPAEDVGTVETAAGCAGDAGICPRSN